MKNLSSCLDGGCENYLVENTMRGKRHYALPLHGVVQLELLTFPSTTAKQHCLKLTVTPLGLRPRQSAALPLRVTRGEALAPPMTVLLSYGPVPFSFQFCGLRLLVSTAM